MFGKVVFLQVIGLSLLLTGCDDTPIEIKEQIRAVKTFTVAESAGGQVRNFSGQIVAANSATLSFPAAGTVKDILVSVGEDVAINQILATLDETPFKLDVEAAEAELRKVQASAEEKQEEYNRNKQLFDKGWVSKAALDQVQFAKDTALEDVSYKTTRLSQAKRSLNDAKLRAPYDGVVGERFAEPNEEVTGGKEILTLDADGALEISISVPEKMISKLNMGMPASVAFNVLPGTKIEGRVTEISRVAGAGNIFPVKVSLINPHVDLRAGMSGTVALTTQSDDQDYGYLIPLSAITAGDGVRGGFVFIFQPDTSTLKKIQIAANAARDQLIGVKGVQSGDLVVTAGVSFLSDGQKVKLMAGSAQ